MTRRPTQARASLHPATVAEYERHVDAYTQPRTRAAEGRSRSSRVVTSHVCHPLVWAAALRQAGGDASRLQVVDWSTVVVR